MAGSEVTAGTFQPEKSDGVNDQTTQRRQHRTQRRSSRTQFRETALAVDKKVIQRQIEYSDKY